jgi:hypothetical protein
MTPPGAAPQSPPSPVLSSTLVGTAQAGVAAASALAGRGVGAVASALAGLRGAQTDTFATMTPLALAEERTRDKKRDIEGKPKATAQKPIQLLTQPLSQFPLERVPPSALAGEGSAQVAEGFDQTKGFASMLAILVLMGTQWQIVEARGCAAANLMQNLAWVIDLFSLRECVSWAFTAKGDIQGQNERIGDFRQASSSSAPLSPTARRCPTKSKWPGRSTSPATSTCAS